MSDSEFGDFSILEPQVTLTFDDLVAENANNVLEPLVDINCDVELAIQGSYSTTDKPEYTADTMDQVVISDCKTIASERMDSSDIAEQSGGEQEKGGTSSKSGEDQVGTEKEGTSSEERETRFAKNTEETSEQNPEEAATPEYDITSAIPPDLKAIFDEAVSYYQSGNYSVQHVVDRFKFNYSQFRLYLEVKCPSYKRSKRGRPPKPKGTHKFVQYFSKRGRRTAFRPTKTYKPRAERLPSFDETQSMLIREQKRVSLPVVKWAPPTAGFKQFAPKKPPPPAPIQQPQYAMLPTLNPQQEHLLRFMVRVGNGKSQCVLCNVTIASQTPSKLLRHCETMIHRNFLMQAPKDSVGPGENSWAAQTSQAPMPSTSRAKEMSPRPSTSATHTGGFLIKQDPGTPPPVQQQVMNPYIQEPPMVQSAPRLLPKPSVPPPQSQVQQQPRLRVRQPQHVAPAPAPPDPDPEPQQVCLRWNSFHNNMQTMFPTLLNKEKFVDVTLACEGQTVKCHKVVLSSCSAYIERLLTENPCKHPIILMPNTMRYWQIRALVDFMYRGEVNVEHEQLSSLLAAAEFLQVKGLAGPPTSPEQNTNMEDPEPEPPLSPRPKRKRVASPSPVPQHRQPVATPPTPQPQQQQQQQQQRTSLPNSPAVSITRLKQSTAVAQATPSTSRDTGSRAQSPGIEITPVVSFEEIKMEPIDISDSNDESMDPNMHCDVDYDMDNGDGEGDKDYDDEDLDEDSGDAGRGAEDDTGGGGGDADPGPSLQPSTSDDQPGTSKTTSNGPDLTTPGFSGNGIEIDDSAASYCAADLGLTTEPPEDPPDSGAGPSGL